MPQLPQLLVSLLRFLHVPLQQLCPLGQSPWEPQVHAPLTQVSPEAQTWPQVPQLLVSVLTSLHVPLQHSGVVPVQVVPQVPQLFVSLDRFLQVPLQWV